MEKELANRVYLIEVKGIITETTFNLQKPRYSH